jgi:signal transduction histidine kinase
LNSTPDGRPSKLSQILYSSNDGLKPMRNATMANPRGGRSPDGRIWIGTEDGVAIIDPARIRSNPVPPPVAIEEIEVDGKPMDLNSPSGIRFKGELVQITYTGLSLLVPERVNFKFLLEGRDRDWVDAGTRRDTTYVNLRPGWYRFRVIAANNDGLWNNQGSAVSFRVDPYFYQTNWFIGVCIAVPLLIAAGAHQMRIRRLALRYQLIAQERARLSRELHDSLLQGFAAVVYQLEAAVRQFDSAPETSKQRLRRALDQADQSLQEGRSAIQSMRLSALENKTLPEALSAVAARLTEGTSIHFRLEVKGRMHHPSYDAQAGLYMIGREAIANAVSHARATRIHAGLTYSDKELRLVVEDNGTGFDPETAMQKTGHWGMSGMRERTAELGGDFLVDSSPGQGTKIEVVVPQK